MRNIESMSRKVKGALQIIGRPGIVGIVLMLFSFIGSAQNATPVAVTGFTADVIANGATFPASVTADVDGGKYYFLNKSFTALGTPTYGLPINGTIISDVDNTITFQLADA